MGSVRAQFNPTVQQKVIEEKQINKNKWQAYTSIIFNEFSRQRSYDNEAYQEKVAASKSSANFQNSFQKRVSPSLQKNTNKLFYLILNFWWIIGSNSGISQCDLEPPKVGPQLPTKMSLKVKCCFAKNGISVKYLIFINIALIISSFGRETIENYSRMDLPKLAGSFLCFQTGSACI